MRVAIISDSHGNLTALDAVLAELDATGPYDAVLFGGDIAYGGPNPGECITRIAERGYQSVRGNTDQMILDAADDGTGDPHAAWIVGQLDQAQMSFLDALPIQVNVESGSGQRLGLVHATPWSIYDSVGPDQDEKIFTKMLNEAGTDLLAYGHIHLQHQRTLGDRVVVAVGSLGLPFDGDQRAMYTVVDLDESGVHIEMHRLEYDVARAIDEATRSDGPNCEGFAKNLTTARRP